MRVTMSPGSMPTRSAGEPDATEYDLVKGDLKQAVTGGGLQGTQLGCVTSSGAPEAG